MQHKSFQIYLNKSQKDHMKIDVIADFSVIFFVSL